MLIVVPIQANQDVEIMFCKQYTFNIIAVYLCVISLFISQTFWGLLITIILSKICRAF